jgi:hypothetical protein
MSLLRTCQKTRLENRKKDEAMKTPKVKKRAGPVQRHLQKQRQSTTPLGLPRSHRIQNLGAINSSKAGKMVPMRAYHLHREDSVRRAAARVRVKMQETADLLLNSVNVRVEVWLVPYLALGRHSGMETLNLSYKKEPEREGEDPVPFFETYERGAFGTEEILETLGIPCLEGQTVNAAYVEAYNAVWNHKATNRSPKIALRGTLEKTLAPAFWNHEQFRHITATYDQAMIAGEVALNIASQDLPVTGIGAVNTTYSPGPITVIETDGPGGTNYAAAKIANSAGANHQIGIEEDPNNPGLPNIRARLADAGISVSLAEIDQARRTAWWAQMREQYSGHEDYIIDMLMSGYRVTDQEMKQPIQLTSKNTVIGMMARHATDAANLTEKVVDGFTEIDVSYAIPAIPTGGIVITVVEVLPDQVFERREDPLIYLTDPDDLPDHMIDDLDQERVQEVYNRYVDVDHDTPDGVFGYAPLNHQWNDESVRIGGRYIRPLVDSPNNDDRDQIWTVEVENPEYAQDFVVAENVHQYPFVDQEADAFDFQMIGQAIVETLMIQGDALIESSTNYAKVVERAPKETIADVAE